MTVYEEHQEVGVPVHCAGLLSKKGLKRLGIPLSSGYVLNDRVAGARFHSPKGLVFEVEAEEPNTCVVDRELLDKALAAQAARYGAQIVLGHRVANLVFEEGRVAGADVDGIGEVHADVVIVAEGVRSVITRGLRVGVVRGIIPAAQMEITGVDVDPSFVELYFGRRIAPGFFAWKIPLHGDTIRIGLGCTSGSPHHRLRSFIEEELGIPGDPITSTSGLIATGGPIERTFGDGFQIVGDAAGQTKPTTGGGVIIGGICALHAAYAVNLAHSSNDWSANSLRRYEDGWKAELGRDLRLMSMARKVANKLTDGVIDRLFKVAIEEGLAEDISKRGDIDFQGSVISFLIRRMLFKLPVNMVRDLAGLIVRG